MKALSHATHGGPEVLRLVHVPDPEPGPVDVVVRVCATAVNRLDVVQRAGWFTLPGFALPHIAGMDVAGEIIALGSDVHDLAIGQRVVIDPSMAEVSEKSNYANLGDRYGLLGVIGATLAAAKELAPHGIRVNAVAPGYIDTDMNRRHDDAAHADNLARIRMGRMGLPEEVAAVVLFLASDAAGYVTGQVLGVDGGMSL